MQLQPHHNSEGWPTHLVLPTSEVKRGAGALCVKSTLEVKGTPRQQGRALSLSPSRLVGRPTLHKGASQHLGELSQPREKRSCFKQSDTPTCYDIYTSFDM